MRFIFIFSCIIFIFSCDREVINSSSIGAITYSTDTLTFDTVFQTQGSATKSFRIYNKSDDIYIIDSIYLDNSQSKFRFNVDGLTSINATNIRLLPNDSIWVFVEVTIDPTTPSQDILIQESLVISYNGSRDRVVLEAFGQDIYLHIGEIISSHTTWKNDKPHVIIEKSSPNGFIPGVIITKNSSLTIQEGSKLHFSSSAGILVDGKLISKGSINNKILMRGIRLEQGFIHTAGQWLGILVLRGSKGNIIEYTIVDESAFGIWLGYQVETDFSKVLNSPPAQLSVKNCSIKNSYYFAVRSMNNDFYAENSEFYTCSDVLMQFFLGGKVNINNCTIFNSQSLESNANMIISHSYYDEPNSSTYENSFEEINLTNTILNSNTSESLIIELDAISRSKTNIENSYYNSNSGLSESFFQNCIIGGDPMFKNVSIDAEDLSLNINSPCIDNGKENSLLEDILGNPRVSGSKIDIGAFEFQ